MIETENVHPLSEFNRNIQQHIQWLKETGKPELLTVDEQTEIVVQSAEAYEKLLQAAQLAEDIASIRRGLEQAARGESRPMREFMEEFAQAHGFSLK